MNTDIRIKVSFPYHHKTRKLKRLVGAEGVLSLITLWAFAAQNKPEGILSGMDNEDIEIAAGWEGHAGSMLDALLKVNFAERGDDGIIRLHDWEENNPYAFGAKERSERAKQAAKARWKKEKKQLLNADSMPPALQPAQSSNAPSPYPSPSPEPKEDPIPYSGIVGAYNKFCPSFTKAKEVTPQRRTAIRQRWNKYKNNPGGAVAIFDTLFKKAEASDFLSGRDGKWSNCNLDWLLKESNMVKVIEGNYDNDKGRSRSVHQEKTGCESPALDDAYRRAINEQG